MGGSGRGPGGHVARILQRGRILPASGKQILEQLGQMQSGVRAFPVFKPVSCPHQAHTVRRPLAWQPPTQGVPTSLKLLSTMSPRGEEAQVCR